MPFDATAGHYSPPQPPAPQPPAPQPSRWLGAGMPQGLRQITPMSDSAVLFTIYTQLKGHPERWCQHKEYGAQGEHCMINWVAYYTEPWMVNTAANRSAQGKRLFALLHECLPKSAQRRTMPHIATLARYNDTHSHACVLAVFERAYVTLCQRIQGG